MDMLERAPRIVIVPIIDGHDWRYIGGGLKWEIPVGENPNWSHLKRQPYYHKECMTCGFADHPDEAARPCHELWAKRADNPAKSPTGPVYYPNVKEAAA